MVPGASEAEEKGTIPCFFLLCFGHSRENKVAEGRALCPTLPWAMIFFGVSTWSELT